MASFYLAPDPLQSTFFIPGGATPGNGAQVFTYLAGTTTKTTVYKDNLGSASWSNPIVLDSGGNLASGGVIWIPTGVTIKAVYAPSNDTDPPVSPYRTIDNIAGINDTNALVSDWVAGPVPTFISATSFSLVGDQTSTFHVGRRVKTTNTGGTRYSTIISSVFGALTTVTVVNDSSTLDAGLSAVSYGVLAKTNDSIPRGVLVAMADFKGSISGLTYANNSGDATNDIDIAAGRCADSTGVDVLTLSALTKQSDAAWAVGTNAGGLDTGAVGNNDYYIWAIKRVDTQVNDVLFSLSSTAPTMPTNYTLKRLIGWFKRVGGTIVAFHTYETEGGGLELKWDLPTTDISLANTLTTARRTDAVKVPLNFSTTAILTIIPDDAGESFMRVTCPDETDAAVTAANANIPIHTVALARGYQRVVRTSATGTVAARASVATVDNYNVVTDGFRWARRN